MSVHTILPIALLFYTVCTAAVYYAILDIAVLAVPETVRVVGNPVRVVGNPVKVVADLDNTVGV